MEILLLLSCGSILLCIKMSQDDIQQPCDKAQEEDGTVDTSSEKNEPAAPFQPYHEYRPLPSDASAEETRRWHRNKKAYTWRHTRLGAIPELHQKSSMEGKQRMQKSRGRKKALKQAAQLREVPKAEKDYFVGRNKKFSDPTGIGIMLPKSVLDILWAMKLGHQKNTNDEEDTEEDEDENEEDSDTDEEDGKPPALVSPHSRNTRSANKQTNNNNESKEPDTEEAPNTDEEKDDKPPAVEKAPDKDVEKDAKPPAVAFRKFNELHAFLPPPEDNSSPPCVMLFLLKQLVQFMSEERIMFYKEYYGVVLGRDTSSHSGIRGINAARYEIFMNDATGRCHSAIHILIWKLLQAYTNPNCSKLGEKDHIDTRLCIVNYCNELAKKDPRIHHGTDPYEFKNHAIIVTFEKADPQDIHIDLDSQDEYQFGVILSPNSKPTWEYKATKPVLQVGGSLTTIWKDMSVTLDEKLRKIPKISSKLDSYGCLLSDPKRVVEGGGFVSDTDAVEEPFPVGTILSLPGMVPHGGPSSDEFRAVLFFTGNSSGEAGYNSDEQANRSMLIGDWLVHAWMDLDQTERVYLLEKWFAEGLDKDTYAIHNLGHNVLRELASMLKEKAVDAEQRSKVIAHFASHKWKEKRWKVGRFGSYKFPNLAPLKATSKKRKKKN